MNITIVQSGTQSPVGTWASMSAASVRAGLARISTYHDYLDKEWKPVSVAMAEYMDPNLSNLKRFLALATKALQEVLSTLSKITLECRGIPLFIGLPKERPGLDKKLERKLIDVVEKLPARNYYLIPKFYRAGHSSGLLALKDAIHELNTERADFCLIGGVESYIDPETLKWLEESGNLKCSANKTGFVPGEAAGFCLLTTETIAKKHGLKPLVKIVSVAETKELTADKPDSVCLGHGLSQALIKVFAFLPAGKQVERIYCDFNGQRHRVDEYGYALTRLGRYFKDPAAIVAPSNLWGDLGAASAPLLISLITEAVRKRFNKDEHCLVFTSSLGADRAALLLATNHTTKPIP